MRATSDRLCREYGLSVIEHPQPGKSRPYGEWRAEQEGRPTYHSIVREDVDEAILQARTEKQFFHFLKEKGYSIKFGKDITIRPEGRERGLKLKRNFGEEYSLESIRRRILEEKPPAIQKEERQTKKKRYVVHVKGNLPKRKNWRTAGAVPALLFPFRYPAEKPPACIPETTSFSPAGRSGETGTNLQRDKAALPLSH